MLSLSTLSTGSLARASTCSKSCSPLRRTSSGQSPHRSSWPDGQASLRFLAPPLPNKPASLGFVWGPDAHACGLRSVFSEAHVPGKNRFNLIPSSADDGTLRGSCRKSSAYVLFRQPEHRTVLPSGAFYLSVNVPSNGNRVSCWRGSVRGQQPASRRIECPATTARSRRSEDFSGPGRKSNGIMYCGRSGGTASGCRSYGCAAPAPPSRPPGGCPAGPS